MSDTIPGCANVDATSGFAASLIDRRYHAHGYRLLGRTNLTTSSIGFGSYRVDDETPRHREALEHALQAGCNLIDTSTNYGIGGSERCIGATLQEMIAAGHLQREEIVVVTKVGYVQGDNLALARDREREGTPFPEMVKYDDHCWHCIHPEFIEDQLARSLQRLRLEKVDVYLLHNPEYFLSDAIHRGAYSLGPLRDRFYNRIRLAFEFLESQVAAGRIAWYGVSSNSFPKSSDDLEYTSITRMLGIARDLAREKSGDENAHHFGVIQFPMNLYETGAAAIKNNGDGNAMSALEFAEANQLGVLINRPLNASYEGRLVRLADFPMVDTERSLEDQLDRVVAMEEEFNRSIAPQIRVSEGGLPSSRFFRWGSEIRGALDGISDAIQWRDIVEHQIEPNLRYVVAHLNDALAGDIASAWSQWFDRYMPELESMFQCVRNRCAMRTNSQTRSLRNTVVNHVPMDLYDQTLSRLALHAVGSLQAVSCVLCGMRRVEYVKDAMGVMKWARSDVRSLFLENTI